MFLATATPFPRYRPCSGAGTFALQAVSLCFLLENAGADHLFLEGQHASIYLTLRLKLPPGERGMVSFDLETARAHEAERRLQLLGSLIAPDATAGGIKDRSKQTLLPAHVLWTWRQAHREKGVEGLLPQDWTPLEPSTQEIVRSRYEQLGTLADAESVTPKELSALAERNHWSPRTAQRWFLRYRIGGLWGLAPGAHPDGSLDSSKHPARPRRAPGTLKEGDFDAIESRYERLGELAPKARRGKVTTKEVQTLAKDRGVSERMLWNDIHDLREHGLFGLADQKRSDYQQHHKISLRMVWLIQGMRLSKRNCTVRDALEMARVKADILGEEAPGEWQVRKIFEEIPNPVKCLADGNEKDFANYYRFTHRMVWDPCFMVMAIDHIEPLHIYVKDRRTPRYRAKSGETRPYLTLAIDFPTRLVMAFWLSYDKPDRFTVAATLRACFLESPLIPFVAVPRKAKVDNGKALNARHVRLFATDLDIELDTCDPHDPQARAVQERMNRTVNTELLATLDGYIDPNAHLPHTPAKLTMDELEAKLLEFFIKYNHTEHSGIKAIPYQFWLDEYLPQKVDPRKLDLLLLERLPRLVHHEGIKVGNRIYWDAELNTWVDQWVNIRRVPRDPEPDTIEVFDDEVWICTATAFDSPEGRAVTAQEVGQAQRDQRSRARGQIQKARQALKTADKEIEELEAARPVPAAEVASAPPPTKEGADQASNGDISSQAVSAGASASAPPSTKEEGRKEGEPGAGARLGRSCRGLRWCFTIHEGAGRASNPSPIRTTQKDDSLPGGPGPASKCP